MNNPTFVHSSGKVRGSLPANPAQRAIIAMELEGISKRLGAYVFESYLLSPDGLLFEFDGGKRFVYQQERWREWWDESFDANTLPFAPPLHFYDKTLAAFTRWMAAQESDPSPEVRAVGRPKAKHVNWAMNEAFLWIDLYRAANDLSIDAASIQVVTKHPRLFAGADQSLKKNYLRAIHRGTWRPYRPR